MSSLPVVRETSLLIGDEFARVALMAWLGHEQKLLDLTVRLYHWMEEMRWRFRTVNALLAPSVFQSLQTWWLFRRSLQNLQSLTAPLSNAKIPRISYCSILTFLLRRIQRSMPDPRVPEQ